MKIFITGLLMLVATSSFAREIYSKPKTIEITKLNRRLGIYAPLRSQSLTNYGLAILDTSSGNEAELECLGENNAQIKYKNMIIQIKPSESNDSCEIILRDLIMASVKEPIVLKIEWIDDSKWILKEVNQKF